MLIVVLHPVAEELRELVKVIHFSSFARVAVCDASVLVEEVVRVEMGMRGLVVAMHVLVHKVHPEEQFVVTQDFTGIADFFEPVLF
jgi:hypothetical protein